MGVGIKIEIVVETLGEFADFFGEVGDLLYQSVVLLVDSYNLLAIVLIFLVFNFYLLGKSKIYILGQKY